MLPMILPFSIVIFQIGKVTKIYKKNSKVFEQKGDLLRFKEQVSLLEKHFSLSKVLEDTCQRQL